MQKKTAKVRSVITLFSVSCLADTEFTFKTITRQEQESKTILHFFAFLKAPDFFKLCCGAVGSVHVV